MEQAIESFLKSERQWTRSTRIVHARAMLKRATWHGDVGQQYFWLGVLQRLED
jgi:hypothetical protein